MSAARGGVGHRVLVGAGVELCECSSKIFASQQRQDRRDAEGPDLCPLPPLWSPQIPTQNSYCIIIHLVQYM